MENKATRQSSLNTYYDGISLTKQYVCDSLNILSAIHSYERRKLVCAAKNVEVKTLLSIGLKVKFFHFLYLIKHF